MKFWVTVAVVSFLVILSDVTTVRGDESITGDDASEWQKFKVKHNKQYTTHREDMMRFNQWLSSRQLIKDHNNDPATSSGFTLGDNQLSDWFPQEYKKLLGFRSRRTQTGQLDRRRSMPTMNPDPQCPIYSQTEAVSDLPASVNWTAKGAVNPVQNQGQCGDCWAFSACGAMEGQYYITSGSSAIMSEQNLVDCTTSYGNYGCNGGAMTSAFLYVEQNKGIDAFSAYPYTGTNGTCHYSSASSVGYNPGYKCVKPYDELALQQAVALIGPISVGIDAGLPSFQLYKSGVYAPAQCSSVNLDHAVLAVGYGTTAEGQAYWLLKNSWGTTWGIQGYMMLARNDNNMCGIASDASFPTTFIPSDNIIVGYSSSNQIMSLSHVHSVVVVVLMKLFTNFIF